MGPRLAVPNEAQNRRQGLQAGRTPGPGGGNGGGAGENPTQQTPKTDNLCRTPGPMPGQLGCIFSPTEPPEVGPTRRPSDSLPQALRPQWKVPPSLLRQSLLCSLAGFSSQPFSLLCLANSSPPRCFRGTAVIRVELVQAGTYRVVWLCRRLTYSLCRLPWLSHRPRHSGKPPPPCTGCRYAACWGAGLLDGDQKEGEGGLDSSS